MKKKRPLKVSDNDFWIEQELSGLQTIQAHPELNRIADRALSYRPKLTTTKAKQRKRKASV